MSCNAAVVGEVTIPMCKGNFGNSFFMDGSKSPCSESFSFNNSNLTVSSPMPTGIHLLYSSIFFIN